MKANAVNMVLLACILTSLANSQTWQTMPNPPPSGVGAILLLRDGSVMAHNEDSSGTYTEHWYRLFPIVDAQGRLDYLDAEWQTVAQLPTGYTPRAFGSAVLPDGRLIIEGGEFCDGITVLRLP